MTDEEIEALRAIFAQDAARLSAMTPDERRAYAASLPDDAGMSTGTVSGRVRAKRERDPLDEARRFVGQMRFILAGGATARPASELDAIARVCDELALLREYYEASEAHLAATQRASRFDEVEAEKRVDAARAALAAKTKEAG